MTKTKNRAARENTRETNNETLTAAARYRQMMTNRPEVVVDVTAPSGFVFQMAKPNTLGTILGGELPQTATNEAAAEWEKQGVLKLSATLEETQEQIGRRMFELREKTIALSRNPKIVIGKARNENELSTEEISDEDLAHLFKWTAAGGSGAALLAMFPE